MVNSLAQFPMIDFQFPMDDLMADDQT